MSLILEFADLISEVHEICVMIATILNGILSSCLANSALPSRRYLQSKFVINMDLHVVDVDDVTRNLESENFLLRVNSLLQESELSHASILQNSGQSIFTKIIHFHISTPGPRHVIFRIS